MKISEVFPSKYVTAADLQGKPFTLTIRTVTLEEMLTHDNKKVQKPVVWFEKAQKGFVMNATNAYIVANLYGDDTSDWPGQRITLYPTQVKAFGKLQACIRVREEIPAQPKPVAQTTHLDDPSVLDDDEDVADFDGADSLDISLDPETGEIIDGDALFAPDTPAPASMKDKTLSQAQLTKLHILGGDVYGKEWPTERAKLVSEISNGAYTSSKQLTPDEADVLIKQMEAELKRQRASNGKVAA